MIFEFLDPKNLFLDTKIITLAALDKKLWPFIYFGGHLGGHLEYFKLLKGESFTPTWISLYNVHTIIISKEKNFIGEFWVMVKIALSLPDYYEMNRVTVTDYFKYK